MSRYFLDEVFYFITVPTIDHQPFFIEEDLKHALLSHIIKSVSEHSVDKVDYGILKDHYHFMGFFKKGKVIPSFLRSVNGRSANDIRKHLGHSVPVWDEYHVYIASTEEIYERIRGYVIGNCLKHGEVLNLQKLMNHPFSTFGDVVREQGQEYAEELVNSVIEMERDQFFDSLLTEPGINPVRIFS